MDELIQGVKTLKVKELKAELKARSITINANKDGLAARLIKEIKRDELERIFGDDANYKDESDDAEVEANGHDDTKYHDANDDELNDDDAISDVVTDLVPTRSSIFTFKDVEESLQRFSGDRKQNLKKWIADFEDTATVLKWTEIHKLVYAKRLLTGAAKMFIKRLDVYKIMKSKLPESQKGTPQDDKSKNDYTSEADEC